MNGKHTWVDAHAHIADPRWGEDLLSEARLVVLKESQAQGMEFLLQGGVGPEDWVRQKELSRAFPNLLGNCFGLHPYWVADHSEEECEAALDTLAQSLSDAVALGEAGLDFRPHISKGREEHQIQMFEQQIELARGANKMMVLHLVQAHQEALMVLDYFWDFGKQQGMVHSFNGSAVKAMDFLKRGLFLSIGGPVCRPENKKLHQAVKEIPLEWLLIESDSPDQPPPRYLGQNNPPYSVLEVAKVIADIKSLEPQEILDITTKNFYRLAQKP